MTLTFRRGDEKIYDGKSPIEPEERYWIYSGEWVVGWIVHVRFVDPSVSWRWTMAEGRSDGRKMLAATGNARPSLDEAKDDFRKCWEAFLRQAELQEIAPAG